MTDDLGDPGLDIMLLSSELVNDSVERALFKTLLLDSTEGRNSDNASGLTLELLSKFIFRGVDAYARTYLLSSINLASGENTNTNLVSSSSVTSSQLLNYLCYCIISIRLFDTLLAISHLASNS